MNRREFLTGTAAGAAGIAAFGIGGGAQAPAPPAGGQAPAAGRGRGAAPIGNPGTPAMVPASKLARISLMQLNFNGLLIPQPSANNPNPTPNANQTLTIFDLPKVYVENYGVHNIEFQHGNIIKVETDPNYIKELKAKLDEYKMTMTQVNLEIGAVESMSGADPLNLAGILTPGPRLAALTGNRLLYRDGVPIALLAAGDVQFLETLDAASEWAAHKALLRSAVPGPPRAPDAARRAAHADKPRLSAHERA